MKFLDVKFFTILSLLPKFSLSGFFSLDLMSCVMLALKISVSTVINGSRNHSDLFALTKFYLTHQVKPGKTFKMKEAKILQKSTHDPRVHS